MYPAIEANNLESGIKDQNESLNKAEARLKSQVKEDAQLKARKAGVEKDIRENKEDQQRQMQDIEVQNRNWPKRSLSESSDPAFRPRSKTAVFILQTRNRQTVNRKIVLNTLIEHETLTIVDLAKEENLGMVPEEGFLEEVLKDLVEGGHVETLDNVVTLTYTITEEGIAEGKRLNEAALLQGHG